MNEHRLGALAEARQIVEALQQRLQLSLGYSLLWRTRRRQTQDGSIPLHDTLIANRAANNHEQA